MDAIDIRDWLEERMAIMQVDGNVPAKFVEALAKRDLKQYLATKACNNIKMM